MRVVVCAANRARFTGELVIGVRHYDALMRQQINNSESFRGDPVDQGFIDQNGVFMDRVEALAVATAAGQIGRYRPKNAGDWLCSEDLY